MCTVPVDLDSGRQQILPCSHRPACILIYIIPSLALSLSNLCHGAAGLPTRRRGVTAPEDAHSISSDEDPYVPPDEVAPDPPTLDWFWGQYNLCLWKSLPPAEKARRVAFKKEMAAEEARYQAACEARDAA